MKHWLVIYDIKNPKRLSKVSRKLTSYGVRVQKSVFELEASENVVSELRSGIKKIIHSEDSVVYFDVCEKDWQKRVKLGVNRVDSLDEEDFYII